MTTPGGESNHLRDDLHPPRLAVRQAVALALAEDVLPLGDITASLLDADATGRAAFVARGAGVVAGTSCVEEVCALVDPALTCSIELDDGSDVAAGGIIARVAGPFRSLLVAERTALNFLCHLSGVATLTRRYVDLARVANPATRVWDTRKTTPGLRALEKAAVRAGGAVNHRGSLSEGVLVKDNHLGGVSIGEAVARALARWPGRMVEVECDRLEQVGVAVDAGATLVLCDNMSPDEVALAVALVRAHPRGAAGAVLVEASGGIDLSTIADFAAAGADVVSVGAITHSAPVLDIGLDLDRVP
ncbi:MAG TPA: carboxylating nicotinate-nucleotide diphosphorylase [Acidimicrobiales bacterium]|nr:carboxylating nicotinate-nucleotide diphosphorylase [Acidimicrobiales bacterium]